MSDFPNKRQEARYFAVLSKNEKDVKWCIHRDFVYLQAMRGFHPAVDDMAEACVDTQDFGTFLSLPSASTYPHI
jgi:hypothetical protein